MKRKKPIILLFNDIKKKRKWTIKDLKKGFFKGPKNLSKNIDKIVYGL